MNVLESAVAFSGYTLVQKSMGMVRKILRVRKILSIFLKDEQG